MRRTTVAPAAASAGGRLRGSRASRGSSRPAGSICTADSSSRSRAAIQLIRSVLWPGNGRGIAYRSAAEKQPGAHALERVRIGKRPGDRHESRRFQIDELARNPLAARRPQRRDHALTRVDRHVAEPGLALGIGSGLGFVDPVSASTWTTMEIRGSSSMAASTSS